MLYERIFSQLWVTCPLLQQTALKAEDQVEVEVDQ